MLSIYRSGGAGEKRGKASRTPQSRSKPRILLLALTSFLGLQAVGQATTYTVVDLGTLGGTSTFVSGMSNSGWVTGSSTDSSNTSWAFLFRLGIGMANLGGLPGATNSQATSVNDLGQVTGNSELNGSGFSHAALWSGGSVSSLSSLGSPSNLYNSFGYGINNGGQIVGTSGGVTFGNHGFIWSPVTQTMTDVFGASGLPVVFAINNLGHYAGGATGGAVLVSGGTVTVLGPGTALAMNDNDQVVGYQPLPNGPMATLYSGGSASALGTLGGYSSIAFGIDSAGNVVGTADTILDINNATPHAFLYTAGGGIQDLNNLIAPGSGWELVEARGIGDNGVIVGNGIFAGQPRGFMLIPNDVADTSPPTTMAFTFGNISGPRTVGLSATDPDGPVASTSYTFNSSTSTYMGPFSVGMGSTQVVHFNSVDFAGNVEGTHQLDVVYEPVANNFPVTVQYDTVTSPGNASVTVSTSGTPTPTGFGIGSPVRYYDITTTASYSGPLIVGISYAGINFPGTSTPRIFHLEGGVWVDSTFAVDTVNEMIYAQTTSLSPFAVFAPLQPFMSFTVNPSSVYNGNSSTATLTLKYPATSMTTPWSPSTRVPGQLVKLSSASPAATIPTGPASNGGNVFVGPDGNTYLFVPEGLNMVSFTVNTGAVTASTAATLTAELYGFKKTRALTVTPAKVASISVSPTSVYNGGTSTSMVTLANPAYVMPSPFGAGIVPGALVQLTSGDPAATIVTGGGQNPDGSNVFQGPDGNTYVFIPEGNTTGTFTVTTGAVTARTVVPLTATLFASTRTTSLVVTAESVASISVTPRTVYNGGSSTGTVTLASPAFVMPSPFGAGTVPGAMVQLTSGDPVATFVTGGGQNPDGSNVFQGPDGNTYMFIPTGNTTGTFTVSTGAVTTRTVIPLTATLFASARTTNLVVTAATVASIALSPTAVFNGGSSTGTVTLANPAFEMPSPFGTGIVPGAMVLLTSGDPAGTFVTGGGQNPDGSNVFQGPDGNTYMFIPQGSTTGTFTVSTTWVGASTPDAITASLNGTSRTATLTIKPTLVLSVATTVSTLFSGQSTGGTITLNSPAIDSPSPFGGGPVPGVMVMLTSSSSLLSYVTNGGPNPDGSNVFQGPDGNIYLFIPAGNTTGSFSVVADTVPAQTSAILTAALNGGTRTKTITLKP